jgi:transposase
LICTTAVVKALARCRPATDSDPTTVAVLTAGKALAQRTEFLERQKQDLTARLDVLVSQINPAVSQINPALRAAYGVGPDTAAQLLVTAGTNPHRLRSEASLAALCGVAPVPASSGKITRHRLSRGGDRAANNAPVPHRAGAHVGPPADPRLRPARHQLSRSDRRSRGAIAVFRIDNISADDDAR